MTLLLQGRTNKFFAIKLITIIIFTNSSHIFTSTFLKFNFNNIFNIYFTDYAEYDKPRMNKHFVIWILSSSTLERFEIVGL